MDLEPAHGLSGRDAVLGISAKKRKQRLVP